MKNLIQSVLEFAAYAVAGARHAAGIVELRDAASKKDARGEFGVRNLLESQGPFAGRRGRLVGVSLRPARQVHGR